MGEFPRRREMRWTRHKGVNAHGAAQGKPRSMIGSERVYLCNCSREGRQSHRVFIDASFVDINPAVTRKMKEQEKIARIVTIIRTRRGNTSHIRKATKRRSVPRFHQEGPMSQTLRRAQSVIAPGVFRGRANRTKVKITNAR